MTDEMRAREEAICEVAGIKDIGDLSDGFHTFNQLYYQRMMLFATIVKQNRDRAWKSLRHENGELCFGGGWFIVGIDTPEGSYTYHYEDNYYSLFDCVELKRGKHWDGHTEKDVTRLLSLPTLEKQEADRWIPVTERLPEECEEVNITWVNTCPEPYYKDIKDKPFTGSGLYCKGRWYWYSAVCKDYLEEYGVSQVDDMDDDIIVTAWRPFPEPYQEDEA